ncbi:ead/Ea22-like family protein [Klebsiella michiganensis]|nr:ead/Ea22-like family protein [Klebsiella michiganensis]
MTTDITELAQILKAAANTTADAIDRLKEFPGDELIDLSQHEGEQVDIDITTINEWYELSSPANILALVEALEKAQQVDEELCKLLPPGAEYMDPPDGGDVTPLEGVRRMVADYRQRIAELESRLESADKLQDSAFRSGLQHGFSLGQTDDQKGYEQSMTAYSLAAGIKVEAE